MRPEAEMPRDFDDEVAPVADGRLATTTTAVCPWCGERISMGLDPGSGTSQAYNEDCEVCCRPWRVEVHYDEEGAVTVELAREDEW